jgi:alpha-ketoglutarate-dependent taurine dioxygenase
LTASGGAIQFKKTPLRTAQDFSDFMHTLAEGIGWTPHVDKGLMVLRRPHARNVATANEGPPDKAIGSHNEYGLSSHYPSYIAFFCLSPPSKGGETPIASSLRLYQRFQSEAPDYLEAIQSQGISFAIHHPRGNVEGSIGGNSVLAPNAFGPREVDSHTSLEGLSEQEKRAIVEENVRALAAEGGWVDLHDKDQSKGYHDRQPLPAWKSRGYSGHWMPDGSFLVVQRTPGVRPHPVFKVPSYFTNVHTRFIYAGIEKESDKSADTSRPLRQWIDEQQKEQTLVPPVQLPPYITGKAATEADSAEREDDYPFPQPWIDAILRVIAEEQVDVTWQVGDVLLIDNLAVQHARRPWVGDRRLLASLWDSAAIQEASRV